MKLATHTLPTHTKYDQDMVISEAQDFADNEQVTGAPQHISKMIKVVFELDNEVSRWHEASECDSPEGLKELLRNLRLEIE